MKLEYGFYKAYDAAQIVNFCNLNDIKVVSIILDDTSRYWFVFYYINPTHPDL